jgi:hypothetical protein
VKMCESMLEIVLFLWGIGKEQETEGGVLTAQFWPADATSSQHSGTAPHDGGIIALSLLSA